MTRGSSPGATSGSSPLARGLLGHADAARGRLGIIPARAGFTGGLVRRPGRPGDHPRSRGVYMVAVAPRTVRPGSSPLARGLPPAGRSFSQSVRIIPARAGFTGPGRRRGRDRRDHPRSRGVYGARARGTCTERGSSPLARGLRMTAPTIPAEVRIIPARAGFTIFHLGRRRAPRDHPRSRGVYTRRLRGEPGGTGSSPLARGLPAKAASLLLSQRIIPARAGFTILDAVAASIPADHPRSRGVYISSYEELISTLGSSPLARGLPIC